MVETRTVPLSPGEAEEFWAGPDARSIAPDAVPAELQQQAAFENGLRAAFAAAENKTCCVGIDMPEAGCRVHSADCPHAGSPVRSGCGYDAGAVPQSRDCAGGVDEKRAALLGQLVFAARDLAQANVADPWKGESFSKGFAGCRECGQIAYLRSYPHASTCRTGRVLKIIAALHAQANPALVFNTGTMPSVEETPEWIIQRCTQKWIGTDLQYEDFPTAEGLMTRSQIIEVLDRVGREHPEDEFKGHRVFATGGAQ